MKLVGRLLFMKTLNPSSWQSTTLTMMAPVSIVVLTLLYMLLAPY